MRQLIKLITFISISITQPPRLTMKLVSVLYICSFKGHPSLCHLNRHCCKNYTFPFQGYPQKTKNIFVPDFCLSLNQCLVRYKINGGELVMNKGLCKVFRDKEVSLHNTNCPVTTCCQTMEKKSKKCNQCDYISSCVSSLRKHLKIHSGEKSNKCSHCDFASYDAGYMREHLNKHSGEKTNKCDQCEFATSYASNFRRHLKKHSGEKPNKCTQCEFACSLAGNLKTHLKTHTGDKSNMCSQCDFASSYASALKTHFKKHSGEK